MDEQQKNPAATEALFKAIMDGSDDDVRVSLALGADPNAPSPRLTIVGAIGLARMRRRESMCIVLAQAGGSEPSMLSRSIDCGNGSWFDWLIENKPWSVMELNDALRVCCEIDGKRALDQAMALLKKGADANARSGDRNSAPLGAAAINRNVLLVKALLDAGADPEQPGLINGLGLSTSAGWMGKTWDSAMETLAAAQAIRERDVLGRQVAASSFEPKAAAGPRL